MNSNDIAAYYADMRAKGLYKARDPQSFESQLAREQLFKLQLRNSWLGKQTTNYYKGLPDTERQQPDIAAEQLANMADIAEQAPRDPDSEPDLLDTSNS